MREALSLDDPEESTYMEQSENLYVVGIGPEEAFREGRAGFHVEQDEAGKTALTVFPDPEGVEDYVEALISDPAADTDAMDELRAGRFRAMRAADLRELNAMAVHTGVDFLVWNPGRGRDRKTYSVPR